MRALLLTAVLVLATATPALADTKTWDGGAGTQQFGDAANWAPNGVPVAGDLVRLDGAADVVRLEDGGDRTIDRLVYTAGSFTVAGRTLTIDGGGGDSRIARTLAVGGGGTIVLAGRLTLLGAGRLTLGDTSTGTGGTLTVASGSALGGGTLELVDGAATVTVEDGASFAPGLVRLTAGDLVLDHDGGLDELEQTGGTLRGSGGIAIGRLTWTGGAQGGPGTTALASTAPEPVLSGTKQLARTFRLERDLDWGAARGTLQVAAGGALENAATLTLADDADIEDAGGRLRNVGALRKLGAARVDVPEVENAAGATLTATGTIGGSVVNAGTVAPGTRPATSRSTVPTRSPPAGRSRSSSPARAPSTAWSSPARRRSTARSPFSATAASRPWRATRSRSSPPSRAAVRSPPPAAATSRPPSHSSPSTTRRPRGCAPRDPRR